MTKMLKIDTLFMTKTAEKPYHLGPHIPIWPIKGSTPPPLAMAFVKAVVSIYCTGQEKPIERCKARIQIGEAHK